MLVRLLLGFMISMMAYHSAAPLPAPWPAYPFIWLAAILAGLLALGWLNYLLLRRLWNRGLEAQRLTRRQGLHLTLIGLVMLAAYGLLVFYGRWADLVYAYDRTGSWMITRLLIVAPLLVMLVVNAWTTFLATTLVNRSGRPVGPATVPPADITAVPPADVVTDLPPDIAANRPAEVAADLPAGSAVQPPAAGFLAYLVFQWRQYILILLIPYLFILGSRDLVALVVRREPTELETLLAVLAALLLVNILSPLMLRGVWSTVPLAPGPLRERLDRAAGRCRVPVNNIYLWRTGHLLFNACVAGLGRPVRYVFLTDALLGALHPAQIEAVYAHELGHAHYRHIPFFLAVGLAALLVVTLAADLLTWLNLGDPWASILIFMLVAGYWGGLFGWISRRFERQSDLAGACTVSCPGEHDDLACRLHQPGRPDDPHLVCPYRAWAFNSALEQIVVKNNMSIKARSWRHGSIASRIRFIAGVVGRPDLVRRYHRRLRTFKIIFLVATAAMLAAVLWLHPPGSF